MHKMQFLGFWIRHGDQRRTPMDRNQTHDIAKRFVRSRHHHRHTLSPPVLAEILASFPRTK